jgi:hypothetical protein
LWKRISCVEELLSGLSKNCRGTLKRAREVGLECRKLDRKSDWMSCFELNAKTLGPLSDSEQWMSIAWDSFVDRGHGFAVASFWQEAIVGVVLCATAGRSCYYWKSYRERERNLTGANNLALWEAILQARASSCRFFELGSMDFGDDKQGSISKFKQSFGGSAVYQLRGSYYRHKTRRAWMDLVGAVKDGLHRDSPMEKKGQRLAAGRKDMP